MSNFNMFSNAYSSGAIAASVVNGDLVIDFNNINNPDNNVLTLLGDINSTAQSLTLNQFLDIVQQNHLIFG